MFKKSDEDFLNQEEYSQEGLDEGMEAGTEYEANSQEEMPSKKVIIVSVLIFILFSTAITACFTARNEHKYTITKIKYTAEGKTYNYEIIANLNKEIIETNGDEFFSDEIKLEEYNNIDFLIKDIEIYVGMHGGKYSLTSKDYKPKPQNGL